MSEVPSLWYDLGLNYYHQSRPLGPMEGDQDSPSLLLEKSQEVSQSPAQQQFCTVSSQRWPAVNKYLLFSQCLKKAIMLDSGNHSYWNALGVISMSKGKAARLHPDWIGWP